MSSLSVSHNHQVDKYNRMEDAALLEERRFIQGKLDIIDAVLSARKNKTWEVKQNKNG